ncbi:MAG: tRNA glutamyl-Q(34) synthetase GluQRS [Planctomycetes bacterium]|nr:tRNA glutamyl-Q(34) synthetase GluQRS [Planctomycetota bacterium]
MANESSVVGRLAPSPTGALHIGNVRTFLLAWLSARSKGGRVIMRIEDIDGPRVKKGASDQLLEEFEWLGLDYDEGPVFQSSRLSIYEDALEKLRARGLAYPCHCTRKDIETASSAPAFEDGEVRYPGTCRPEEGGSGQGTGSRGALRASNADGDVRGAGACETPALQSNWRALTDGEFSFVDGFIGPVKFDFASLGDFVIFKKDGLPSYQLAVSVDDALSGVTEVVRGDDLLSSTPRQLWIYRKLTLASPREWYHVPLVVGEDGRKLAKRHGDTTIREVRARGVSRESLLGFLAFTLGLISKPWRISLPELVESFSWKKIPKEKVIWSGKRWSELTGIETS